MGFVSIPVRLARTLHSRWLRMGPDDRERLAPLARDARDRALDLRGTSDREAAERELNAANESSGRGDRGLGGGRSRGRRG